MPCTATRRRASGDGAGHPRHPARSTSAASIRAASQKPGIASLSAPVELVEPTGAETIAVLRLGDQEIVGRFDPDEAPRMGEEITLGIDMAHACLFDPATRPDLSLI